MLPDLPSKFSNFRIFEFFLLKLCWRVGKRSSLGPYTADISLVLKVFEYFFVDTDLNNPCQN